MNILIISDYFTIGGNTTYITNVKRSLEQLGHDVILITFRSQEESIESWHFKKGHFDILIKNFKLREIIHRIPKLFALLNEICKTWKPDLVISDLCIPAGSFIVCRMFLLQIANTPFFYQFLGSNTEEKISGMSFYLNRSNYIKKFFLTIHSMMLRRFERFVLQRVNKILLLSKDSESLVQKFDVTTPMTVVTPGVEPIFGNTYRSYSKKIARRICGFSDNRAIALTVSRLEPRKGVFQLLDNLHEDASFLSDVRVIIASQFDSYSGADVLKMHSTYGFGTSVLIINNPNLHEKALLYRAADVVIVPSLDLETFGFVPLEAMATGTPVVAYSLGAFRELIDQRYLVKEIGEGSKLLQKVKETIKLTMVSSRKTSASLVRRSKNYTWEVYSKNLIQLMLSERIIS